ncbi:MAG: PDDEXK nuclease domain-containing protein [Syntrophomonadaceae bacterium]|jgi:predicted nuclease of restriction endonuclease-like (RecB) superfamily|nr:PDDEXK nuclease domain-containing protein [Syntrophomonadaceae bacterium]
MAERKPISKKNETAVAAVSKLIDENALFERIATIIENRKTCAGAYANLEIIMMYWEIGRHISSITLDSRRTGYGKQIVATLAQQLQEKYGNGFDYTNVSRMMRLAERFPNFTIVAPLAQQLSWSHFTILLPLKSDESFMFYANDAVERKIGKRELRRQISRKAFERCEIADLQLTEKSAVPFNMFKDPYLLDALGLKNNYLEADLEKAILTELEEFILEFGNWFTFVDRQKRMTMDGDDYWLDLLFYHRKQRRLVAVELKIDKFRPDFKGQMEFYLKWLNRYERLPDENEPIGLILCPQASRGQ